jgi:uncharacterized membrane protein YhaH (DUF805 family)
MATIILSYRRDDTGSIAGRIFDRLVGHYGPDQVFMDIDSIPFGLDFREHIQDTLKRCDVLLAIVGKNWAAADESGALRINEENDWVRIEVEAALAKNIPVIPVLIDNALLPAAASLPESLRNLAFRQAAPVDSGRDFHPHMDRLIKAMDQLLAGPQAAKVKPRPTESAPDKTIGAAKEKQAKARTTIAPGDQKKTKTPVPGLWLQQLLISPQGRLPRRTFVVAVLASFILLVALVTAVTALAIPYNNYNGTPKGALILLVPWNWVMVALGSKRLHDLGWTAWLMAIPLLGGAALPYMGLEVGDPINTIILNSLGVLACLLPLAFIRGTEGPNRYGPDPLGTPGPAA